MTQRNQVTSLKMPSWGNHLGLTLPPVLWARNREGLGSKSFGDCFIHEPRVMMNFHSNFLSAPSNFNNVITAKGEGKD